MLRKANLKKVRQQSFDLSQRVNETILPSYNALRDPYLSGFFQNPILKRNLRKTGVVGRKKSHPRPHQSPEFKDLEVNQSKNPLGKRSRSLGRSNNELNYDVKLPALEQILDEERKGLKSAATSRSGRQVYRSSNYQLF